MFNIIVVLLWIGLTAYSGVVVYNHGVDFVSVAIQIIAATGWSGQFALDFVCYLLLSALWVAWRHRFTASAWLLALAALVGGYLYFGLYLAVIGYRARGDVRAILLGERAASA